MASLALVLTAWASAAHGQTVAITGGADATGHTYTWQITNDAPSQIVEVRFPNDRNGLFFPPRSWSSDCTSRTNEGIRSEPGACTARANSPEEGIAPGRSAPFSMQVAARGTKRGRGEVVVRFADGSEARVAGVELPQREGLGDKYVSLIALGAVFLVFVVVRAVRKRRRGSAAA